MLHGRSDLRTHSSAKVELPGLKSEHHDPPRTQGKDVFGYQRQRHPMGGYPHSCHRRSINHGDIAHPPAEVRRIREDDELGACALDEPEVIFRNVAAVHRTESACGAGLGEKRSRAVVAAQPVPHPQDERGLGQAGREELPERPAAHRCVHSLSFP